MALLGGVMVAAFSRVDALVQGQDLFVQAAPCMRPTIRGAAMSSCKLLFQKHSYLAVFPYLISIGCLRHPMPSICVVRCLILTLHNGQGSS